MDGTVIALLAATLVVAAIDWWAVGTDRRRVEYVAKPLTMVVLIAAALALDPADDTARTWFVVALVLSLAGDVFLMLPRDLFVPGLASFLLGHVAYIVGLLSLDTSVAGLVVGAGIIAVALPWLGLRILRAVRTGSEPELAMPVTAYVLVISAMVVSAGASGSAIALAGAVSFYVSDALIAWTRFIQPLAWGRVAVMVTYHAAQVALVASLV
ncbi:lysoplasmalogenase [Acidimicrobiia bacterium EGI L10123]|uniref:lysoplasmalogenase n=1 Tax=Salinilacustrithrix flava TaxID=2957203 RepID=UPI003D7C33A6|nr:lysoplasmalogenase [Acidimicrobiia bacterium EGI L10123]